MMFYRKKKIGILNKVKNKVNIVSTSLKKERLYNWWESGCDSEDEDAEEEQLIRCDGTVEYIHGDLSRTGRYGRAIRKELNVRSTNRNEKWNF